MYIVYLRRNCKRQNSIVEHGVVSGVSRNVANSPKQKQCKRRQKLIHIFSVFFLFFQSKKQSSLAEVLAASHFCFGFNCESLTYLFMFNFQVTFT